jgi:hypothetical protein
LGANQQKQKVFEKADKQNRKKRIFERTAKEFSGA